MEISLENLHVDIRAWRAKCHPLESEKMGTAKRNSLLFSKLKA